MQVFAVDVTKGVNSFELELVGAREMAGCPRLMVGSLDCLGDHILLHILDKIQDGLDRRAWRLVCKTFFNLESGCRKRVQLLRAEMLENVLRSYKNLEDLDLSFCTGLTDDNLMHVSELAGAHLLSINLSRISGLSNAGLFLLTCRCNSLVDVDLSYCTNVGDTGLVGLAQLTKLQKLKLVGCFRITDAGMGCLAAGCKKLQVLILKGCIGITDAGIQLLAANCEELIHLDLSFTEIANEGINYVAHLKTLRTLSLMACHSVGDKALSYLEAHCKSLVDLDVSRCENVSSIGIAASPALECLNLSYCGQVTEEALIELQKKNSIQSLKLDGCEMTATGLNHVAAGCKELRELSLSKCRGVTDRGIPAIATCTGLSKLDLTCCCELTEVSLFSIATCCTALRSLTMESCPMVTDASLSLLWEHCRLLEELDATDCNVTDAGLISVGKCASLRVLKLAFTNVGDDGLLCIGAWCRNLTFLDLYRCRGAGDVGVISVASGCKKLRALNLSYCSRISDASMTCIAHLSELCQLEIRGCTLVTSAGLQEVAEGCKRLVELDIKRCTGIDDPGVFAIEHFCPDLRQINVSYCPLTNRGLMALAKLGCMQNMKLVHLRNVSMECFGNALLKCGSLRKVKLLSHVRSSLPSGVVEELESRGCRLRWMDKRL